MKYLLIALGALVVLVVLYLIARRVKPFGQALAFVCTVVSRVNIKLAACMNNAADYCHTVGLASLRFPPGSADRDYWNGIDVLSRLVFFMLAVLILAGETVNTLLVLPALFQTANHVSLPGIVDIASAALFICCPALFGAVIWECWGKIPLGAGLFPRMGKLSRWVLGVIAGLFLLFTILVNGYFYLFRALYLADPQSAQGMVPYILSGLGIEVAAVSPFAVIALVVGGAGVVSLILWIVEQGCRVIASSVSLWPSLLDVVSIHLSGGTISVHGEYIGHDPYKVPALLFPSSGETLPGQTTIEEIDNVTIFPVCAIEKEEKMSHTDKNAFIGFYGQFGSRMFAPIAQKITMLRATESILTSYFLERTHTHVQTSIAGIRDLSHPTAEKNLSILHGETEHEGNHILLCDLGHKLSEAYHHLTAVPSPFVHFIDCHELVNAVEMLESNKRRLPLISQVVITSVSEQDSQNKGVQTGIADLVALHAEGFIDAIIVVDPRSPFARHYGEETQLIFLAQLVISLLIAHKHHAQNPAFASVFRQLCQFSPFIAVSFASQVVAVGNMPKRWSWLPLSTGSAGSGYYADIISQVREATDRVVTEEDTRTFPAQVRTDAAGILLYNIPLEVRDRRFASCVRDNSLNVSSRYPFASSITVRGNGCSYPRRIGGRFLVQASCLYPLQPASFPRLQGVNQVNVTSLYPVSTAIEPARGNGHMNTEVKPAKSRAKKTLSGSSKTAVTRRVARKNTRQAK